MRFIEMYLFSELFRVRWEVYRVLREVGWTRVSMTGGNDDEEYLKKVV